MDIKRIIGAMVLGGMLYMVIRDPEVPPEVVEEIANSDVARGWATRFCGKQYTGEAYEKCLKLMSKYYAKKIATKLALV